MKYEIIEANGTQFQVKEGETIILNSFLGEKDKSIKFDHILLFSDGQKTLIGNPYVENIVVEGKIIKTGKGEKVNVYKFKAKVRYRRHIGFRPIRTEILIGQIKTAEKEVEKDTKPKLSSRHKKTA